MIYTSTELFNEFLEDTRQIMVKVTIGNRVFDNDNIATLNLEYGSMDGGSLDIGGAFANSLKIGFSELVEGLAELDEIEVEMGAVLPNGTVEYVPMGTFVINEEVMMDRNNNTTSIDAMDRMVMLGEIYEPMLEGDYARIIDIAVDIANQAGVVVSNDFDRLRTDSIQIPREKTLREAIGIIAQFEVGFATFNRDGELAIRRLNDPDFDISPEDYTMKGLVKNEVPFRLNGVQCQIGDSEEDVLQTGASTGTQIVLNNPSMTQAHLDRIYTELSTLNYYPFSLDWYGHPALEAGDWIEIEDLQGNKFKTPNLHYTLDFNGGLKAKSQAETTSSSEVVYQYKSPLKQEIQAIAARLSASGGNHVYDDLTEPENPKEGDLWFKPEGPDTLILKYTRLEDGTLDWVEELNTGDTTKNAREIEKAIEEIEDARQVADEAVDEINTAIQNAGFTSLDDTLQNMNYITMEAEQNAQQAIANASNAYGLAQTSISEAQTAQANSLTALGKADNALDGVSSLNVRVDDVEAELELKADNTFMNEDGTLTTLSNAITFNAHRFSSDMSRIESRVESLSGAVNLVVLRDAFKGSWLTSGEVYPNATKNSQTGNSDTMREMIDVTPGEQLALTKTTVPGDNYWRINCYTQNMEFITRLTPSANETVITVPDNAHHIWVSYPQESNPQIVRGETFVPYRPNLADQMTSDEMVIFRNEYDEFADKTERRLTNIDISGGRLDTAELLITQTADGLALKADQTTVNELTGEVETLGAQVDVTAGQITNRVWETDIQTALDGFDGRNLIRRENEIKNVFIGPDGNNIANNRNNKAYYAIHVEAGKTYMISQSGSVQSSPYIRIAEYRQDGSFRQRLDTSSETYKYEPQEAVHHIRISYPNDADIKMEVGNRVTPYSPAPEDTDAKINHVESSLTIEVGRINALNTRVGSNETFINDLSLTPDGFWVRTARYDRATERIESIATLEQTVEGLQSEVYNADGSSKITQLATGVSSLVTNVSQLEEDGRNLIRRQNEIKNSFIGPNGESIANNSNNRAYYSISVEAGKTYMISQSGSVQSSPYIRIAEYRNDGSFRQRLSFSSETYMYVPEEAVDHIRISYPNDANIKMEVGNRVTPYSPAPEDTATTSQISQLADNINLRVKEGELLSQINVEAGRTLIESKKILLDADNVVFTGKAWIPSSVIGDLEADKITSGRLDAGKITVVNLDVSSLSGNTAEFVTASFNGINSSTQIDADGIYMSGSGLWRRTYLTATGFDLYNDHGGNSKAGAVGYFKEHYDNTTSTENYFATTKGSKHYIGIGANNTHHIAFGYQDDSSITRKYTKALQIDGDTGRIRVYRPISPNSSSYSVNLTGYDENPHHGMAIENSTSGIMFANSGTKIWDESGGEWDDYNMSNRRKIGFYGDSGVQADTANNNMEIWAGGSALKFYVGTNELRFQVGRGAIQAYTDIGMNGNIITGQSDERLKTNIRAREELIINKLKQFNFVDFDWIESGKSAFGLIAQQVQKFAPELVSMDETNMLTLNNTLLNMYTTKSVVEINQKVDDLRESTDDKIHKLQQELSKANRRIEELEGAI